jgi:hypothetical protein
MPASHIRRQMATPEEMEAFRRDYFHEIDRHQKVVGLMKRHDVQSCRTEPEGAFDMRLAYDDFNPRGGADPRPASATDRSRRPARDQQQPPSNGTRPTNTMSKPMFDQEPEELLARLKTKLGPEGFERVRSLLVDDTTTDQLPKPVLGKPETGQDQEDDEDQFDDDDTDNGNGSKLSGKLMSKILAMCAPHLSDDDNSTLQMLLKDLCKPMATDDPPEFGGMPKPGGSMVPMKPSATAAGNGKSLTPAMDCGLGRIKVDNLGVQASPYRPQPQPTRKQMAMDSANRQSFASRNPEVARIKVL